MNGCTHVVQTMARTVHERLVLERSPNHDSTNPSYAAWTFVFLSPNYFTQSVPQDWPKWAIQVHDSTATAGDERHRCYIMTLMKLMDK